MSVVKIVASLGLVSGLAFVAGKSSAGSSAPTPARAPVTQQRASLPALSLDGAITDAACGKKLHFSINVANASAAVFQGDAILRVSGGSLASDKTTDGGALTARITSVPARGQFVVSVVGGKVDCFSKETFLAVLLDTKSGQPLPGWDRQALELVTAPPTECQAATSHRKYAWNPKL